MAPLLSICVPSRNRQVYFQETIRALLENKRTDVEFIFTDNSDEPEIMDEFIAALPVDPRFKYLRSGKQTFSMVDNWERTVAASSGDWVTVIGDDDYLDPDLVTVLSKVSQQRPDLEAFEWQRPAYGWPDPDTKKDHNATVSFGNGIYEIPKAVVMRRAFQWEDARVSPIGGFSIYHAAVSRKLLLRIKQICNGRFFEHPTVDFDNAFKVAWLGTGFAVCERPFSILGACPKSMSAALHDLARLRQRNAEFMADLGRNLDDDIDRKDFPFSATLGVTASVMHVHIALKEAYGLSFSGWESNFVKSCVKNCEELLDQEMFETVVDGYRGGFKIFQGGRYLKHFNPVFNTVAAQAKNVFSGHMNGEIYISLPLLNAQTPAEFYALISAMVCPIDDVDTTIRQPAVQYR